MVGFFLEKGIIFVQDDKTQKMLCDFKFNENLRFPGMSPVRHLYPKWIDTFNILRVHVFRKQIILLEIIYDCTNRDKIFPWIENNKIFIPESFLSFLWMYSYSLASVDDTQNLDKFSKGLRYSQFTIELLLGKTHWDPFNYPNPELVSQENMELSGKANNLFLSAVNFTIMHEAAHILLDHAKKKSNASNLEIKQMELEADNYALRLMMDGNIDVNPQKAYGVVTAATSMIIVSKTLRDGPHPDPNIRMQKIIAGLSNNAEDSLWKIACMGILLWTIAQGRKLPISKSQTSIKDWYLHFAEALESSKNEL